MENTMKKQCKKILLWRCRGFLSVALSGLTVVAHAQSIEVCTGTAYTIASTVNASGASTYQWLENGQIIPGASAATYTVPSDKATGLYAYIRQAKSADCTDWQPSNEFVVTVFACSFTAGTTTGATATFTDPRDGKNYKTVVMPDGRTWFAQNLNYTKDLTYNPYAYESNGKQYNPVSNGISAIGSYWCPAGMYGSSVVSGSEAKCRLYGALYTWETAMMVDGKYADETKTSSAWDESWVSPYYYSGAPGKTPNADRNNGRGGTNVKGGGRGICPMGWHIPTQLEWAIMLDVCDGDGNDTKFANFVVGENGSWLGGDVGKKLKSASTCTLENVANGCWITHPTSAGIDSFGFSALPAGSVDANNRLFVDAGVAINYATSSVRNPLEVFYFRFRYNEPTVFASFMRRYHGRGLRCIRDN
jgi:uncharacterized protein (TIGR02145 family)